MTAVRWSETAGRPADAGWFPVACQRLKDFDTRHPLPLDLLVPLLLAVFAAVEIHDMPRAFMSTIAMRPAPQPPPELPWLLQAAFTVPLVWRRRKPFLVVWTITVTTFITTWWGLRIPDVLEVLVAFYSAALRVRLSRLVWPAGAVIAGVTTVDWARFAPDDPLRQYLPVMTTIVAAILLGITVRTRRDQMATLVERAKRLEIERDQREQIAAAAERSRIAREMHDIIAHNLSVIIGLADGGSYAARTSARYAERPAQALEAISSTGRQALSELRRLLGVLRDDTEEQPTRLTPQPGIADLERLFDQVRDAGLPVRSALRGSWPELSRGRQLTVFRIVQEALTNALKHGGPGTTAAVTLSCTGGTVDLEITDTGRGASGGLASGPGLGINGMRQRAAVYDGTVDAGPRPEGGWLVHANLPSGTTSSSPGAGRSVAS